MTRLGRRLRATRLDELPQFWAVVKGDLSLIGPRPEREVFYREFEKHIHGFSQRMMVKPGITGLAQVNGGYDLLPAEKVLYDFGRIRTWSVVIHLATLEALGIGERAMSANAARAYIAGELGVLCSSCGSSLLSIFCALKISFFAFKSSYQKSEIHNASGYGEGLVS